MSGALVSDEKRDDRGRFLVPPLSPGRPKGARNKLGEAFLQALEADFAEHGVAVIEQVRSEKPEVYIKVVAGLLPTEANINVRDDLRELSRDELRARIRSLGLAIAPFLVDGHRGEPERIESSGGGRELPN